MTETEIHDAEEVWPPGITPRTMPAPIPLTRQEASLVKGRWSYSVMVTAYVFLSWFHWKDHYGGGMHTMGKWAVTGSPDSAFFGVPSEGGNCIGKSRRDARARTDQETK